LLCSAWLSAGATKPHRIPKCRSAASPSCPRSNNICCRLCMWRPVVGWKNGSKAKRSRQPENRCDCDRPSASTLPSTRFPTATFSSLSRRRPATEPISDPKIHHEVGRVLGDLRRRYRSQQRITLLRDADGDEQIRSGRAFSSITSTRPSAWRLWATIFMSRIPTPSFRYHYKEGDTTIAGQGTTLTQLPGGPIDHHWTKSLVASEDGSLLYVGVGSNSNITENGMEAEKNRAASGRWTARPAGGASSQAACATQTG